jgi:RNA polymerase sigma factor (sigma-70 family)
MAISGVGVAKSAPAGAPGRRQGHERDAWRSRAGRLYEELRTPAARMVRRAFGRAFSDEEIEDVYGNAWLGTLRALGARQASLSDEEIRKYVFTAVAHHASKELRRRGRRPTAPLEAVGDVPDLTSAPDERAASGDERRLARDLLASLPARRRAVMLLRYGCGLEPRQICTLVKGLSPRAYRKEITRGVDELTEKLRLVERGAWCADREPLLKAFAAGIASEEEARQVRHHLSRCRDCSELVGRLSGHLHDLGGALTMPAALEGVRHGTSWHDYLADFFDRVRGSLPGALGGSPDTANGGAGLAASGSLRGGGAAGAGLLSKVAGLGAGGKIAAACLAGGAVATTCAATGVLGPIPVPGPGGAKQATKAQPVHVHADTSAADTSGPAPIAPRGGQAVHAIEAQAVSADTSPRPRDAAPAQPATATVTPSTTTTTTTESPPPSPLAPSTPPVEQQFGVAAASSSSPAPPTSSTSASAPSSGGSVSESAGGGATQQEFGP